MAGVDEVSGFKPPYMAFQTFWRFIDELSGPGLPPVIDRSLMSSKSGTDQANLVTALRSFNLINDDNTVNATFNALGNRLWRGTQATAARAGSDVLPAAVGGSRPKMALSRQLNDSFRNGYGHCGRRYAAQIGDILFACLARKRG
ncbi:hypothetical protein I541_2991 [Mycobacteroides abscessus]|nr:hypothetical protein I541_2991 [Mycobacteroides abscessus]